MRSILDRLRPDSDDGRTVVTDQEQARIERAEIEARREAIAEYADERREEAKQEELEKLRNGTADHGDGFVAWVLGGLKKFDQEMKDAHGSSNDGDGGDSDGDSPESVLGASREPQMPDPLGDGESDDSPRFGP